MTTITLPKEQVKSLAKHLENYKTTDADDCRDSFSGKEKEDASRTDLQITADEIKSLKDLTNKGAELYL